MTRVGENVDVIQVCMYVLCAGGSVQEGGAGHDGERQTAWTCGGAQPDTGDLALCLPY